MAKIPIILEPGRADGKLVASDSIFDKNKNKFQNKINQEVEERLNDVKDTLNSDSTTTPLSAKQGKVLKELLDSKVIETGSIPIDSEPILGNTTHIVNSDGLAKEFNKCNTTIINTDRIANEAIVPSKLSTDIQSLISNLSKTATFAGIATPTTNPGTPDGSVFYIATQAGSYSNFSNIEVLEGETVILKWNSSTWVKSAFKPMTDFDSVFDAGGKSLTSRISTLQPYIINSSNDIVEGNIANGVWYNKQLSFIVPLIPGKSLSITGNSKGVYYSILRTFPENIVIGATPDFATGYSNRVYLNANSTVTKIVPSDGEFLVITHLGDIDAIPTSIIVNGIPYDIPIHKKIAILDNKDNFILNSLKDSVIWNNGYINDKGNAIPSEGHYYTNLLPIVDGYDYEVWGVSAENVDFKYYSAPYIDSEYFLGSDVTGELSSTAKYITICINGVQDIENVKVISNRETTKLLINTPFKCSKSTTCFLYPEKRITLLNFVLFAVKGFYFYGDSVNPNYDYAIGFAKSGTSLRVLIKLESATIIDKRITIPENGIIDKTETVSGYSFRIIADCNNFADFSMLNNIRQMLCFNKNAFSPIIGNPLALETSIKELNTLKDDINDPDKIIINTGLGDIVDYLEYITPEKGATTGYIINHTGAQGGNSAFTRTDYISLKGIYAIKVKTPVGSNTGFAFYTGNDALKYAEQYISGGSHDTGGNGNTWVPVPNGARYFRTTVSNTDISNGTAVLQVHKYTTKSIQEYINSVTEQLVPRATHVLFGYEQFLKGIKQNNDWSADIKYLEKSRNTYVVETEDENAKQMISDTQLYFNKMQIEAHFEVGSSDAFFGIGTISSGAVVQNEARIHNVDGNAVFEVYSGLVTSSNSNQTPRVVISKTMSFALTVGNTYKLGMRKFENEMYDNVEHMDGVVYYVKSLSDDILYEEFVPKNSSVNNGIRNGLTASCKGSIYVSVKKGTVTVDNIFVSSKYDPQAKVLLIGDSYSDGESLIYTDSSTGYGQKNKFACLLQSAIGDKSFVIAGKGGDGVFLSSIPYLKKEVKLFCPEYCILQYGANHSNLDIYKTNMEEFTKWLESLDIKPILVTTPPVNGIPIESITQMNDWVKNSGYRYVDQCKAVSVDGAGLVWKDGYVYSDSVHPTALGHRAIYEAFVKELPELFAV